MQVSVVRVALPPVRQFVERPAYLAVIVDTSGAVGVTAESAFKIQVSCLKDTGVVPSLSVLVCYLQFCFFIVIP